MLIMHIDNSQTNTCVKKHDWSRFLHTSYLDWFAGPASSQKSDCVELDVQINPIIQSEKQFHERKAKLWYQSDH